MVYLLGACISGFIFMLCLSIDSFKKYLNNSINEAKNEMKKDEQYSLQEITLIEHMSNDSVINILNILVVLFSWVGLIFILFHILGWMYGSIKK